MSSANSNKPAKGQCLCGAVKFSVTKFQPLVAHCHCKMCQRFHGAAFSTFVEVKCDDLIFEAGEQNLGVYHAENLSKRMFCKSCGSSLFFESQYNRNDKTIEVALAAFDDLAVNADAHIYTESKACWYQINDGLPQFKGYRE